MIASASIPVGFPLVMIDVEAGGNRYQEMHVDFNLAFIPANFNAPHPDEFDNAYKRALY
jgi:hypothetical protein